MKSLYDILKEGEGYEGSPDNGEAFVFKAFEPSVIGDLPMSNGQFQPLVAEGLLWSESEESPPQERNDVVSAESLQAARERAEKAAAEIVESARRNGELIEREAYEKGYKQGEVAGEEIGKKKFASAIRSVETAFQDMVKTKTSALARMEPMMVELALCLARKVVHGEILVNPDVIVQNLRACTEYLVSRDVVTVRLNPSDHKHAASFADGISKTAGGIKNLVFEPDAAIARGGAMVVTEFGELDACIDRQLDEIESSVRRTIQERTQGPDSRAD